MKSTGNTDRFIFFLIKSTKVLRGKESSETTDDEGSKRSSCVCCNENLTSFKEDDQCSLRSTRMSAPCVSEELLQSESNLMI